MKVIPARPTLYKGIRMRSRLEADYAASLDRSNVVTYWEYEPVCFGNPEGQWLPDFREAYSGPGVQSEIETFTELKPLAWIQDDWDTNGRVEPLLRRMTSVWDSRPEASLQLVFWEYQAEVPALQIFSHRKGSPWMIADQSASWPFATLWTGMGQWVALSDQG